MSFAASTVSTEVNKELAEIRAMMKQLADSVTAQDATVAALYFHQYD